MLTLTSPSFAHLGEIPAEFTCEGRNVSPALAWDGVPAGCRSLALIVDDPDAPDPAAPQRVWVHWVLYDLPPTTRGLAEAVAATALPGGTLQGRNDWGRTGYGGPCPPIGRHRYFHKLFALDAVIGDLGQPDAKTLARAIGGHVIEHVELVGTYRKQRA